MRRFCSEDDIRSELDACAAAAEDAGVSDRVCETVAIVFITLETLPVGTLKRWGKSEGAVSKRSLELWRGFCRCVPERQSGPLPQCRPGLHWAAVCCRRHLTSSHPFFYLPKAHQRRIFSQGVRVVSHRQAAAGAGGHAGPRRSGASGRRAHASCISGALQASALTSAAPCCHIPHS